MLQESLAVAGDRGLKPPAADKKDYATDLSSANRARQAPSTHSSSARPNAHPRGRSRAAAVPTLPTIRLVDASRRSVAASAAWADHRRRSNAHDKHVGRFASVASNPRSPGARQAHRSGLGSARWIVARTLIGLHRFTPLRPPPPPCRHPRSVPRDRPLSRPPAASAARRSSSNTTAARNQFRRLG